MCENGEKNFGAHADRSIRKARTTSYIMLCQDKVQLWETIFTDIIGLSSRGGAGNLWLCPILGGLGDGSPSVG